MRHQARVICAVGAMALSLLGSVATAEPFEEGRAAYEQMDYTRALQLWRPLAEHGDARAQYMLALSYYLGHGVQQDYVAAANWYRMAAAQGDRAAEANLGALYASGQSVPQDYAEAIKWWRKAAD